MNCTSKDKFTHSNIFIHFIVYILSKIYTVSIIIINFSLKLHRLIFGSKTEIPHKERKKNSTKDFLLEASEEYELGNLPTFEGSHHEGEP